MKCSPVDSENFMHVVLPLLEQGEAHALAEAVKLRWTSGQLCQLLHYGSLDVRKVVCLTLGLVGCRKCTDCLAHVLRDEDTQLSQMAEHALWSIWFRSGNAKALPFFKRGLNALNQNDLPQSLDHFHRAIQVDPNFAEALNQCAIAHYLLEEYAKALEDCLSAVELVPIHFGALAGMGHCYAQMEDLPSAARCYQRALQINPRMDGIAQVLVKIETRLKKPSDTIAPQSSS